MGRKNKHKVKGGPEYITLPDGSKVPVALPPGMSPKQMQEAIKYMKANPDYAKSTMEQALSMDPASLRRLMQAQKMHQSPAYQAKLNMLKEDPELQDMWADIKANGQQAMAKYWEDPEWMEKISAKMGKLAVGPQVDIKTLHDAAKAGNVEKAKEFLDWGVEADAQDDRGISPLGIAVGFNRLEMVEFLLSKGVTVDARDGQGNTPLHYAAGYGRKGALELLLAAGADRAAANKEGKTPLDVAKQNREASIVKFLEGGEGAEEEAEAPPVDPKSLYL